ncbi:MAG: WD40 repeat domain-containing protein, partial [Leptolyngbya sp. SIO3F4]|nr:WD40 repeat domain-containing protein [Leptolyngbya sp. SIO3F4]
KKGDYDGLHRIANTLPKIDSFPLIIMIDQFEEVYSLCENKEEQDIFVANLLYAARERSKYVSVIITLRSDFLAETHRHPGLNRLISSQGFLVSTMDEVSLKEVISIPASRSGYSLDQATIQLLIEQTIGQEGVLPLLQFTLEMIWKNLDSQSPLETLKQLGGVGGALANKAQETYDGLNSEKEREIARRIFLGLVQLGEGAKDTRRRADVMSLMAHSDNPKQFRQVLESFASEGARLITVSSEELEKNQAKKKIVRAVKETAEVSHEALFQHWQQLNNWIEYDRDNLRLHRRLESSANHWYSNRKLPGLLWRRPDLDLLRKYYRQSDQKMTTLEIDFFRSSVKREGCQKVFQALGVSALFILALGMTWFGVKARLSQQQALAQKLAVQAERLSSQQKLDQREVGALLAVESLNVFSLPFLQKELIDINHALRYGLKTLPNAIFIPEDLARETTLSPDGRYAATLTHIYSGVSLWNTQTGEVLKTFEPEGSVHKVAISLDGQYIGLTDRNKKTNVRDAKTGHIIATFNHTDLVDALTFSPDNKYIATVSKNTDIQIWNLETGVWKTSPDIPLATFKHSAAVLSIAFSPEGNHFVTASKDKTTQIWEKRSSTWNNQTAIFLSTLKHEHSVNSIAFSPNGEYIATASKDKTVRLWDFQTGKLLETLDHNDELYGSDEIVAVSFRGK